MPVRYRGLRGYLNNYINIESRSLSIQRTRRAWVLDGLEYLRHIAFDGQNVFRDVSHRLSQPILGRLYPSIDSVQQYAMVLHCTHVRCRRNGQWGGARSLGDLLYFIESCGDDVKCTPECILLRQRFIPEGFDIALDRGKFLVNVVRMTIQGLQYMRLLSLESIVYASREGLE